MLDSASTDSQPVSLRLLIAPFARAQDSRAWWQVLSTVSLFLLGWASLAWSVVHEWGLVPYLLIALPTAGMFVRLFIVVRSRASALIGADSTRAPAAPRIPAPGESPGSR